MNGVWRVVAVGALVLVAGCSGTSSAGTGPSLSSGPVSTATVPAQPAPTRPPDEGTPEGAVEFAYYFWALYNHAYATLDTAPLEAVSDKECVYCAETIKQVRQLSQDGEHIEGFEIEVLTAVAPPGEIKDRTLVTAPLKQAGGELIHGDGSRESLRGYANTKFSMGVRWDGSQWSVHGIDYEGAK